MLPLLLTVGIAGAVVGLYLGVLRPRHLRWGATDAELARTLPGDDLVPRPSFDATRAVTVRATPEAIWPWLVQMGFGRAGWYSYDWLDNLARSSAERIVPELQRLEVGDRVPLGPCGFGLEVQALDPPRAMVWGTRGRVSWAWWLQPTGEGRTRLLSRVRIRYRWYHPSILANLLIDVGDFPMMRRSLLGIRRRAETAQDGGGG